MIRAVVVVVVTTVGCGHHVNVDRPPAASAPEEVRAAYFAGHALEPPTRDQRVLRTRQGATRPSVAVRSATMKNGLPITRVEDLRPLVDDDSVTARSIDRAVAARGAADGLTVAGGTVAGAGLGVGLLLFAGGVGVFTPGGAPAPVQGEPPALVIAGVATAVSAVVVGGGLVVVGSVVRDAEDDATTAAFKSYDDDLRSALGLPPP